MMLRLPCVALALVASCGPTEAPGPTTAPPSEPPSAAPSVPELDAAVDAESDAVIDAAPAIDLAPLAVAAPGLAVGGSFACATLGDGAVSCWGDNRFGQLGDPSLEANVRSYRRRADTVAGLLGVASVSTGTYHACALGTDGHVECWGHGAYGQLGDGEHEDRAGPVTVAGLVDAIALGLGEGHGCALRRDGTVVCWGKNEHGQLGDGTFVGHGTPAPVPGLDSVLELVVGRAHACVRRDEGEVLCWGENVDAQLGDGGRSEPSGHRATPALVAELGPVSSLAAGYGHSCAAREGEVLCWGRNDSRQLGDGRGGTALDARLTPTAMRGANEVATIAAGARHTCVVRADGTVACVGLNARGQLGDGSRRLRRTLTAVPDLEGVTALAAGVTNSCAIAQGRVVCWGDNRKGQLGDGQTDPHRSAPRPVLGLPPPATPADPGDLPPDASTSADAQP